MDIPADPLPYPPGAFLRGHLRESLPKRAHRRRRWWWSGRISSRRGSMAMQTKTCRTIIVSIVGFLFLTGCVSSVSTVDKDVTAEGKLNRLGYTIQVGAFANIENAVRLTDALNLRGLEAFYFCGGEGLYRVRFGDYSTREEAVEKAEFLQAGGILGEFYIVPPDVYPMFSEKKSGEAAVRERIVNSAKGYIGIPYRWGGESTDEGFDCSGLTMAVYRLNGLRLPRTSKEQYATGLRVTQQRVREGDLVFFATGRGRTVSHVGVYIGKGHFIHAPGRGGAVRMDSLSSDYYGNRYVGARSYL